MTSIGDKYSGSSMEHLWNRLNAMDFINKGMLFAAILLLCFFPFIIIANALAGESAVTGLVRHLGLNQQAAKDVSGLFASSSATSNAVTGTAWLFFILAVVASIVATVVGGDVAKGVVFVISALLILTSPVVILSRILRHRQVTAETLLGAVCVYILLGLVFSYSDYAVQLVGGTSFFAQSGMHNAPDFVYYSYITMTTVGYGDLTPAVGLPRTMAVIEALTGQIFLVVLVARLVSMYQPKTRGARLRDLEESTFAESTEGGPAGSETSEDTDSASGS